MASPLSHAAAHAIVIDAWRQLWDRDPTEREVVYSMAVASLETGYGRIGQFGRLADQGGFNWGALETRRSADGSCPSGTMPGSDQGSVCFYVFPDDTAAAKAFLRTLTKSFPTRAAAIVAAMNSGTPTDVARAMRTPPAYYAGVAATEEGKVAAYASAIQAQLNAITGGGLPAPDQPASGGGGASNLPWVLAIGLVGAAAYLRENPKAVNQIVRFYRRFD